jgi:hypothetical protein
MHIQYTYVSLFLLFTHAITLWRDFRGGWGPLSLVILSHTIHGWWSHSCDYNLRTSQWLEKRNSKSWHMHCSIFKLPDLYSWLQRTHSHNPRYHGHVK